MDYMTLRRGFVTNGRRRGVAESVVMRMSGHRTRSVFDRYNVIEDEDLKAAVRKIETGRPHDLGQNSVNVGSEGAGEKKAPSAKC
jgi:hypothetical protein